MILAAEKVNKVGRKKRPIPARTVKIDGDLVTRADMLAKGEGQTTSDYLSDLLRPLLDREWAKALRKASEEGK